MIISEPTPFIDNYCERTDASFWSEPINFMTNLAFIMAAVWLFREYRSFLASADHTTNPPPPSTLIYLLIFLLGLIGVGSGLFHSFATPWAEWMDVIPILLFQLTFLSGYLITQTQLKNIVIGLLMLTFLGGSFLVQLSPLTLNGSIGYLPAILFLAGITWHFSKYVQSGKNFLLYATLLFLTSLFFRTIDAAVCQLIPIGTHFLWHLLNSAVLACCITSLYRNRKYPLQTRKAL